MQGLAGQLFREKKKEGARALSLIESLLKAGCVTSIDCAFVEQLFLGVSSENEAAKLCTLHLIVSARSGHLCIRCEEGRIYPSPQDFWLSGEDEEILSPATLKRALSLIIEGFSSLPSSIVTNVSLQGAPSPATPLCMWENRLYLQKNWMNETLFLHHYHRLLREVPALKPAPSLVEAHLQFLQQNRGLLPEQVAVIANALQQSVTIIVGGPGTGKTTLAGHIVRMFMEETFWKQKHSRQIILAAPTGKAAESLQASIKKACEGLPEASKLVARTLHAVLGKGGKRYYKRSVDVSPLAADVIIVDEGSMIDVTLMSQLLARVKPGARLILLGDGDQLPPVEAGSVFADLCAISAGESAATVQLLTTCMRAELQEIVSFSRLIQRGDAEGVLEVLTNSTSSDAVSLFALPAGAKDNEKAIQKAVVLQACFRLFSEEERLKGESLKEEHNPKPYFTRFQEFRILSPLRQGVLGVDTLNLLIIEELLSRTRVGEWVAIPILIAVNDYRLRLFNGEVGVLFYRHKKRGLKECLLDRHDQAFFPGRMNEEGGARAFSAMLLPVFEYAYCLSVHKSQGSECNHVLLVMPEGSEVFGREVVYTAVTRARRKVEVCGSSATLKSALNRHTIRESSIAARCKAL